MTLLKVELTRKKPAPFTREKSENESKNELFLGLSGINFREKALTTLGFVPGDKIGFTPDVDAKEGETIETTTGKVEGFYLQKEAVDGKTGYKLGTNNAITGTGMAPYLVELAGVASRFSKLEGAKPTELLHIDELEETIKGKQLVFEIAEEPIEFEGKLLYAVTFKEIVESKRGRSADEKEAPTAETAAVATEEVAAANTKGKKVPVAQNDDL